MTDRRTFITAALVATGTMAAPSASASVGLLCTPTVDTAAWDAALARYEAILAEANAFWRNVEDRAGRLRERYPSKRDRLFGLIDYRAIADRSNAYGEQVADAKDDLRGTPAPTLAALVVKYDLFFGDSECCDEGYAPAWNREVLEPFLSDLRRFAGEAQS